MRISSSTIAKLIVPTPEQLPHMVADGRRTAGLLPQPWFNKKTAPEGGKEDGCHPDEAWALKDYLKNKTSPPEAAHAVTRAVGTTADPSKSLYRLCSLLIDALVELPDTQTPALLKLLDAIQQLPEPESAGGGGDATASTPADDPRWRGLPNFGHMWAD
jgi:hypothetical protein